MISDRDKSDWSRLTEDVTLPAGYRQLPTFLRWSTRADVKHVEVIKMGSHQRAFRMTWVEFWGVIATAVAIGFCWGYFAGFITGVH